jgi:hypothetical protein
MTLMEEMWGDHNVDQVLKFLEKKKEKKTKSYELNAKV